ncbi:NAD-dependent epimerase/dehydratase family protein [Williamsia sp. CHRR-6]|uniref:NAD-dependent epimerase/dehydratase family protein n=1 Tax=Williamsia sp. CHRR-6 TaxID=2835871 RepID=UPI001BDA1A95|nr:NAD-dependent epimerase/dehydratase family protein [Williamsia sp. CHRR-6]MBT0565476.1 NAD-dependent epimerase/dehydratase family protein [Williamsia sp. CHRR-6]
MTTEIDTSSPVLVTGATGYVAGWIIKELLDAGATVHAAVRDPANADKIAHLDALAADAPGTITYFRSDLLRDGSYDEAMAGCAVVFHTASPFTSDFTDPQRDLIDPAVEGTRTVLESANRTPSVRRVVLTSSVAAIFTDAADGAEAPGGVLTEDVWNTSASLTYEPYNYSKTLAEKKAWEIAEAQSRWSLVVINPSLVIGPGMQRRPTSESFAIVKQLGDGTMRLGAPKVALGVVDVRDVATAHIAAAFRPDAAGRHITSAENTTILDLGLTLRERFGSKYPLPRTPLPKFLMVVAAPFVGRDRRFVSRGIGVPLRLDNSKSRSALGVTYRPMKESLEEMFEFMIEQGYFKR